jgi:hypothetical protein
VVSNRSGRRVFRTGRGVDASCVITREMADEAVDGAQEALRRITAEATTLRGQVQAARARLAKLSREWEKCRRREVPFSIAGSSWSRIGGTGF